MKKTIIIVVNSLDVGGTERHLISVLPKLVSNGWPVRVITTFKKGVLAPEFEKRGIPVCCVLDGKYLTWIQKLPQLFSHLIRMILGVFALKSYVKKRIQDHENTILHFYLPEAYIVGMLAAGLAQFKGFKIMSRRSLNCYQQKSVFIGWLEKKLHSRTSVITGNCQALVSQLQIEENVPLEHLRLIYNGIDTAAFIPTESRNAVRSTLGIQQDALVIVKVANLIPYKGHVDLLVALSKIKDKLPECWYLICLGRDDGIGSSLRQQAENLGLSEHILWLGTRSDISNVLFSADIGVLCPFKNEGFSNAILEGMTAGLPMVVTDIGGNKEAVINGKTGYVVEPRHTDSLAAAILDLANNLSKAKQFGEAGQKRVKESFSLSACVDAYEKLYNSL